MIVPSISMNVLNVLVLCWALRLVAPFEISAGDGMVFWHAELSFASASPENFPTGHSKQSCTTSAGRAKIRMGTILQMEENLVGS